MKQHPLKEPFLPLQDISVDVLREKYAHGSEEKQLDGPALIAAIRKRVAGSLAAVEAQPATREQEFIAAMNAGFIPGGRINHACGTDLQAATLINCFVQPLCDVESETHRGQPDVAAALAQAAACQRRGGGVGFDFSAVPPKDAKSFPADGSKKGPLSCMCLFDQQCAQIESAGTRRGAQMAVLRIDHPDIFDFVQAKQQAGTLANFNLSVGVTDEFMQALDRQATFELRHQMEPSQQGAFRHSDGSWVYRRIEAAMLWDAIVRNSYQNAEPGVLFLDRINRENNLYYLETIAAVNPCGEVPLPAFGCCCLGSLNLPAFVRAPFTPAARFDWVAFRQVVGTAVRMLDNVLDINIWTLPAQRQEALGKRRIGLGFTGLGDALIELGLRYDRAAGRKMAAAIARTLRNTAYRASVALAREKGAFPLFDAQQYLQSGFALRLPEAIRHAIRRHGIRNSHLLAIAPAGTISIAFADNCANGIEPAFAWRYARKKRLPDDSFAVYTVENHAYRLYGALGYEQQRLPAYFADAHHISALNHLRMQAVIQPYIDSSISKTVNIPEHYPFSRFRDLFFAAWKAGLKGITVYRQGSQIGSMQTPDYPRS